MRCCLAGSPLHQLCDACKAIGIDEGLQVVDVVLDGGTNLQVQNVAGHCCVKNAAFTNVISASQVQLDVFNDELQQGSTEAALLDIWTLCSVVP